MLPKLSYNLFFERTTEEAIKELAKDVRRTLRGTLRSVDSAPPDEFLTHADSFLKGWDSVDEVRPTASVLRYCLPDEHTDTSDPVLYHRGRRLLGRAIRERWFRSQ